MNSRSEPVPPSVMPRALLALSGGAAMGLAHIGVIGALVKAGITITGVAGTSMGAVVAAFLASGRMEALETWALAQKRRWWIPHLDPTFGGGALLAGGRIARLLQATLGPVAIESLPMPFAATAVDLRHDRPVVLTSGPLAEAVRAAIAVPGLIAGVERDGAHLVDGVLLDPVPVAAARALGPDPVIAVNLYADPEGEALHAGLIAEAAAQQNPHDPAPIPARSLVRSGRKHLRPDTLAAAAQAVMIRRIAEANLARTPADLVIEPKVAHLGLAAFHRASAIISEGWRSAESALSPTSEKGRRKAPEHPEG